MFADSFNVLSVHCVARRLGAIFLYKCPASRGGSLQRHDLLVRFTYVCAMILRVTHIQRACIVHKCCGPASVRLSVRNLLVTHRYCIQRVKLATVKSTGSKSDRIV